MLWGHLKATKHNCSGLMPNQTQGGRTIAGGRFMHKVPRRGQAIEKVDVGLVSGPQELENKAKTLQ